MQLDLQHFRVDGRPDGAPFHLHEGGVRLRFGRRALSHGLLKLGRRRLYGRTPASHFLGADRAPVFDLLGKLELSLQVFETRFRHRRPRPGYGHRLLSHGKVGPKLALVELEQGVASLYRLASRDEDVGDDPSQWSAHGDVLGAGLDQPDGRDRRRKIRYWRRSWRLRAFPSGLRPGDREGCPKGGQNADEGQDESFHANTSLGDESVLAGPGVREEPFGRLTSTIRPSSMWAILWA